MNNNKEGEPPLYPRGRKYSGKFMMRIAKEPIASFIIRTRCLFTGATIFTSEKGNLPRLTTASIREMLAEFS